MNRYSGTPHPFNRLRSEMEQLFANAINEVPGMVRAGVEATVGFPALTVWEDKDSVVVEAELPGLDLNDIELFVKDNELTVRGERKPPHVEGVSYHRQERGTGKFQRVVRLPVEIDADKVDATLKDGVLTVRLTKAAEAQPRKVNVRAT